MTDTPPPQPRQSAAAIQGKTAQDARMTVHGFGARAEDILAAAFAHDVKVRRDPALMEILDQIDEGSPIPLEALEIVTEILARVYAASVEGKSA